jgi:hypothetical protein
VSTALSINSNFDADFNKGIATGTYYIGLQTSDGNYGWAEFGIGSGTTISLLGFAMDTIPNEDITAGQVSAVPEPSPFGWIAALAAFSLVAMRSARDRRSAVGV